MNPTPTSRFELVPVDDIELDRNNPRIARWLEMYGESPTAEQIALALGSGSKEEGEGGPSFAALKQSILTNGGIIHPIIVNKGADGRLIAIEGNTRVQIYREFREQSTPGNWNTIPAMVYDLLPESIIDAIRLQAHLVGVRQWKPYLKGRYLNLLYSSQHLTLNEIVDFCGGDKREVQNLIQAFNDMEKYYTPILESDQDFDPSRFSAFVELQERRVQDAILKMGFTKTDFAKWVDERKLYPLSTVRELPRILQNVDSSKVFLKSGAREALKHLDIPTPETALKDATLEQLARQLCKQINEFRYEDLQRLKNTSNSEEVAILITTRDRLSEFCDDINAPGL